MSDIEDLMRGRSQGRPFATFLVSDLAQNSAGVYAFAKATSRALRTSTLASTGMFTVHGPPAEPTNLHAHVIVHVGSATEDQIRRDILTAFNDHGLLAPSPFIGPPRNRKTERDNDYGFSEWLDRCGFYDRIIGANTPRDVADTLAMFDVVREPYGQGFVLRDRRAASGVAVKASSFDLSDDALIERFGTAELPASRTVASRSYTDERHSKYPAELHEAHAEARSAWEREIAALVAAERRRVYDESTSRRNRRDSLARALLSLAEIPADEPNLEAARRLVYRDTDRYVERELRAIEERFPPKPARRIGDWLRQLHDIRPTAVASAPGAVLTPLPGQRQIDECDRNLYDEDSIIVAHQDTQGVELRTLDAHVALRGAREIVLNYRLDEADIPERYRDLARRFAKPPPGVPDEIQELIDNAPPHQLERRFAPAPAAHIAGAQIDLGTDDEQEQVQILRRTRRPRTRSRR